MKIKKIYARYVTYITVTSAIVTLSIMAASGIVGGIIQRNLTAVQTQAVDKQIKENRLLLESGFNSYAQVVKSGVGLTNAGSIDRAAWSRFISTYQLQSSIPAISSMIMTQVVRPGEYDGYEQFLSEQYGQPIQISGAVNESTDANVLAFVNPERTTTINNIGFNIYSDPTRQRAAQAATDSNEIVISDVLRLIVDARQERTSNGAAFLMYVPYYTIGQPVATVDQRRTAIKGHVAASFRADRVFEEIFSRIDRSHVSMGVYMGEGENRSKVYTANASKASGPQMTRVQTLRFYGQTFAVEYKFDSNFLVSDTQLRSPVYTVTFGMFVAVLVGTITFFFLRGRHHRLLLDKERDVTRAKDELLSLASHQLRTPATGVKQYIGMVLQGFAGHVSDTQIELLEKAYKSNERQLHVINDILHLAKLDLGRIVLAKSEFNLSELIKDVVDEQDQDLKAAKLRITVKLPKKAIIYADKHMIRMAVENIISNAIKYTDSKGKVTILLKHNEEGYTIAITDTGVGIAEADLPKLFKQFSRLMNDRSHLVTGTGVGLYLAKHLVVLHDGDIVVESELGKGSTFTLFLPYSQKIL